MYGSDESRASARNVAQGYQKRLSIANFFATISPDTASTYTIGINCALVNEDDVTFSVHGLPYTTSNRALPNRSERKRMAGKNPYLSAKYAKLVLDAFIENFLGWDTALCQSKKDGGAFGMLRWFTLAAEAQKCADVHFHIIGAIAGLPKTTAEFHRILENDAEFGNRYTNSFHSYLLS
jgi:hypothetical protein